MDGEKERRNLLIISTAILLFFWLDLPEGVVAERVLGNKMDGQINPGKVWFAITLVLIYQVHRWFCVINGSSNLAEALKLFNSWRSAVIRQEVALELNLITKGDFSNLEILSMEDIRERYEKKTGEKNTDVLQVKNIRDFEFSRGVWKGSFSFIGNGKTLGHMIDCEFIYPNRRKLWVDSRIAYKFLISKFSSEYVVPTLVSYASLWLTVAKLTSSVL